MRRVIVLVATTIAAVVAAGPGYADPSHNVQEPLTQSCDNNTTVVINPGTVTNRSHQAFVVGSNSIFVVNRLAFTNGTDTFVVFDTAPGLNDRGLVTCTADVGGGFTLVARGFFTPTG